MFKTYNIIVTGTHNIWIDQNIDRLMIFRKRHHMTKYRVLCIHLCANINHIIILYYTQYGAFFTLTRSDYGSSATRCEIFTFIRLWIYSKILAYTQHTPPHIVKQTAAETIASPHDNTHQYSNTRTRALVILLCIFFFTSIYWPSCKQYNTSYALYTNINSITSQAPLRS